MLEAVACGLLLPDGLGLRDPCERGEVDAASALTPQQREDVTTAAQRFLRMAQFNQMHAVLGIERVRQT